MGKIDKIKEHIGWLKVAFAIAVATDITLIGWLVTNYEEKSLTISIMATSTVVIVSFIIILINKIAFKKMDELEEL